MDPILTAYLEQLESTPGRARRSDLPDEALGPFPADVRRAILAFAEHGPVALSGYRIDPRQDEDGIVLAENDQAERRMLLSVADGHVKLTEKGPAGTRTRSALRHWLRALLQDPANAAEPTVEALYAHLGVPELSEIAREPLPTADFDALALPDPPPEIVEELKGGSLNEGHQRRGLDGGKDPHYRRSDSGRWVLFTTKGVRFVNDQGKVKTRNVKGSYWHSALAADGSCAYVAGMFEDLARVDIPSAALTTYVAPCSMNRFGLLDASHLVAVDDGAVRVLEVRGEDVVEVQRFVHPLAAQKLHTVGHHWVLCGDDANLVLEWRDGALCPIGTVSASLAAVLGTPDGGVAVRVRGEWKNDWRLQL